MNLPSAMLGYSTLPTDEHLTLPGSLQVNDRLQSKVYLAGSHVTLADLVLFTTLHRALVRC